ncbi:MAG: NADP-reducing hydrogenase subunit HndC [Candidatus Anoxychlamydiales bacterium]|nr:NADP-reducing hydrogenase subunit HndC [Candidatus Anoxychlamydiales bacterium]NGX35368.1 NADP-reducing hydrogenase subunit HndC [Candidatus Anoxychlamydiales bacterium]
MNQTYTHYEIDPEKCVSCGICAQNCPVSVISGEAGKPYFINQEGCTKCGTCFDVCPYEAVKRS